MVTRQQKDRPTVIHTVSRWPHSLRRETGLFFRTGGERGD